MAGAPVRAPGSPASASTAVPSTVPATIAVSAAASDSSGVPAPAGLQHEDRAGEAEQAHPEVAPQAELVEQAQRLRHRLGQGPRDLGAAVTRDGDEGVLRGRWSWRPRQPPYAGITRTGSDGRWRG